MQETLDNEKIWWFNYMNGRIGLIDDEYFWLEYDIGKDHLYFTSAPIDAHWN